MNYFLTLIFISVIILLNSCISSGSEKDVLNKLDAASKAELLKAEADNNTEKLSIVIMLNDKPDEIAIENIKKYEISEFNISEKFITGKAAAETIRKILNSELVNTIEINKSKF